MSYVTNVTVYVGWEEVQEQVLEIAIGHLKRRCAGLYYMDPEVKLVGDVCEGFAVSFVTEE